MNRADDYDNAIKVICAYYNVESFYDKVAAPLLRRRTYILAGCLAASVIVARFIRKELVQAANKKQIQQRIFIARMRRQREFDLVKYQIATNPIDPGIEKAVTVLIESDGPLAVFESVRERRFRLQDVVRVYQKRCLRAQELCNPITHMFDDAADQAAKLDDKIAINDEMLPLYGLVYSVKEMYGVAGTDSTSGISSRLHQLAHEDSVIVKTMRELGAVLLCKTNFPQTLFSSASSNPVYGVTTNPHDRTRSPGGSSSGEGALQALSGTMLGWGSDIGGSVRIPAHFCGVASFRPVNDRFCGRGVLEVVSSSKAIISTYGILSRDVRLIALVHRKMLNFHGIFKNDFARLSPPLAWRQSLYENEKFNLRIGYFLDDGYCASTPGVQRAVKLAMKLLCDKGHILVPFEVPEPYTASIIISQLFGGDRRRDIYTILKDDEVDPNLQGLYDMACVAQNGSWLSRSIAINTAGKFSKKVQAETRTALDVKTPEDLCQAIAARDEYRAQFLDECRKLNLDLLLSPVTATPALKLGDEMYADSTLSYTMRFNLLNLPAGVVPVTTENESDQHLLESLYPEVEFEDRMLKSSVRGAAGMPLGVQLISCNPYNEEICFQVMSQLQQMVANKTDA